MAERLAKISTFGEYTPYHFTAAQTNNALDTDTHGHFLGHVCINTVGTSTVITLSNGPSSTSTNIFAVITPTVVGSIDYEGVCDRGLYVTIAGSGMDITIMANDMAV
jgi:hypothetical protein